MKESKTKIPQFNILKSKNRFRVSVGENKNLTRSIGNDS